MLESNMRKIIGFFKKDIVFLIAMIFAIFSMFLIPPSREYLGYINTTVIIIMFSLMVSVSGMKEANLFSKIAIFLTSKFFTIRYIALTIVISTFFLGMWVTNDAVLLTLVPFTLIVTKQTGQEKHALIIVILQTFAANMGASLTPMGDPQNIYLYSYYNIAFGDFIKAMLPITGTAFVILMITTYFVIPNEFVRPILVSPKLDKRNIWFYFLIFLVTILAVLGIIPAWIALVNTLFWTILFFPRHFKNVDYHLLLTFMMFFIFTGNLGKLDFLQRIFTGFLDSNYSVYFISMLMSQFISNVPASVFLSPFVVPDLSLPLLQGVNVGAMGTLIASLASLITFKFVAKTFPDQKGKYVKTYTFLSIVYMIFISMIVLITY